MPFHRYITPTYFGGLPGTHDLINVISGGVGSGDGSAPVNPAKPAPHPNEGTYFVAFGENATSANANRGFAALAENTDFIDDVLHRDQVIPVLTAVVVPGAPVNSLALSGDVFVGEAGETNDTRTRTQLVQVLTDTGLPLTVLVGTTYQPVRVTAIHDGGPTVVGNEFQVDPTIDLSPAIPAGTSYRLSYYVRGNVKSQPLHTYSRLKDDALGTDSLLANVNTILLANNTFAGNKIFTGDIEIQGTTTFEGPVTVTEPLTFSGDGFVTFLGTTDTSPARFTYVPTLLMTADMFLDVPFGGAPAISLRQYFGASVSPNAVRGEFTTLNAVRDTGGGSTWSADVTSEDAIGVESTTDGWMHIRRVADMDTGLFAGTWTRDQWLEPAIADEAAMSTQINGHTIASKISDITNKTKWHLNYGNTPFHKVDLDISSIAGQYVYLSEPFNLDAAALTRNHRIYGSSGGTGPNGDTVASFCLTSNARWDVANAQWVADTAAASNREAIKYSSELDSFVIYQKSNTAAAWADSAWEPVLELDVNNGLLELANDFNYGYLTDKPHTHVVSHTRAVPGIDVDGNAGWQYIGFVWISRVDKAPLQGHDKLSFPLNVPSHTDSITVEILCQPGAARSLSNRVEARLYSRAHDWAAPTLGTSNIEDTAQDDGTTSLQVLTVSHAFGTVLDSVSSSVWVEIVPGGDGATNQDDVYDIRVTFTTTRLTNALRG